MLRYYYINKEWMLSSTARRTYRAAAVLSLVLFCSLWVWPFVDEIPAALLPILKLLLLAGVLGAATTVVAMEYFLFGFDKSPAGKKVLWFCVTLIPLVGPPLYCFVVYSPQSGSWQMRQNENKGRQNSAVEKP
ncbi:MAG: hypothetical protein WCC22_19135 [Terriglobales bacterium]